MFSHAGAVKVAGFDEKVYQAKEEFLSRLENGDELAELAFETMINTIA